MKTISDIKQGFKSIPSKIKSIPAKLSAKLAGAKEIHFVSSPEEAGEKTVTKVLSVGTVFIPMGELVDLEKEKARLEGELEKVTSEIARADGKLNNQGFLSKAPKKLIDDERAKLDKFIEMREKIINQLKSF